MHAAEALVPRLCNFGACSLNLRKQQKTWVLTLRDFQAWVRMDDSSSRARLLVRLQVFRSHTMSAKQKVALSLHKQSFKKLF